MPQVLSEYYASLLNVEEVASANKNPDGKLLQPANVKKIHDIIRCALNNSIKWDLLDSKMRNPSTLAITPEWKQKKSEVWDIEVFKDALSTVDDLLLELAMNLAFAYSLRFGEIAGLTWEDVIIDDKSLENSNARVVINKTLARVSLKAMQELRDKDITKKFPMMQLNCTTRLVLKKPKTESSNRTVWLPTSIVQLLKDHKHHQKEMKEFFDDIYNDYNLVLTMNNGNPVEGRVIRRHFKALCDANNYEFVDFHSLRHLSTAYKLKITGGDIKSVQGDTGHADAEMVTNIYSRIIDEDIKNNAKKLEMSFYKYLRISKTTFSEDISKNTNPIDENALIELFKSLPDESKIKILQKALQNTQISFYQI